MLKRFNRYPLIIDPSGQATDFIMNEYRDKKITKTSFLDDSFRKNLESALRFGNPLLVQVFEVFKFSSILFFIFIIIIFFLYIYITPGNNLPLVARKPQSFTNIDNEQIIK
jgi:hypothetical protein